MGHLGAGDACERLDSGKQEIGSARIEARDERCSESPTSGADRFTREGKRNDVQHGEDVYDAA